MASSYPTLYESLRQSSLMTTLCFHCGKEVSSGNYCNTTVECYFYYFQGLAFQHCMDCCAVNKDSCKNKKDEQYCTKGKYGTISPKNR